MQVVFEQRKELALGIWHYFFKPERYIDYVPGQYVDLLLKNVENDARGSSRTFSLTSLPSDPYISFVTKHFSLQTSYKHALQSLKAGNVASMRDAMGDLVLPKSKELPLVFVAGGIGVASYISMIKELLEKREERSIFLFYEVRSRREQIFKELLITYPLTLVDIAIAPNRIAAEHIKSSIPPNALIYLSGSQQFVEELREHLEQLGTPRSQIIFDYFDGYLEL